MNHMCHRFPLLILLLLVGLVMAGCGGTGVSDSLREPDQDPAGDAAQTAPEETDFFEEPAEAMSEEPPADAIAEEDLAASDDTVSREGTASEGEPAEAGEAAPAAQDDEAEPSAPTAIAPDVGSPADQGRRIIKNAEMMIEAESVDLAMSSIGNAAAEVGGYVLETRTTFDDEGAAGAVVKIAVPVERFEAMLERIRGAAARLLSEQATGTDVSQEYVDVESQLDNLEATQARIREFLDQATSVEESLRVNAQLNDIERQISQLKGRLQYLEQRSAFSTITVQIQPTPVEITPTPTPSPTPAPVWSPNDTAQQAYGTLSVIVQSVATLAIWIGIVVVPLALPVLLVWLAVRARRRPLQPTASSTPSVPAPPESSQGD